MLTVSALAASHGPVRALRGVALTVGPGALVGQDWPGELACLLAALCYGLAVHHARRIEGVTPANKALGQLIASSALLLPVVLVANPPWTLPAPSTAGWVALLGIAIPCTAIAYLLFFDLIARAGANNTALVTLLVPVSAVLRDDENLPFVYVTQPDGSFARRHITLGSRIDDRYAVPEGLNAGDRVVTNGGLFMQFLQSQ